MTDKMVVASKVKSYIKQKAGLNTSAAVVEPLSRSIQEQCDRAIENAQRANRKTVLERDFERSSSYTM